MRKQKSNAESGQIRIDDIKLSIGDKLYRNGVLYGEIMDIGDTLYFLKVIGRNNELPTPYHRKNLIENILMGSFTLESVTFK